MITKNNKIIKINNNKEGNHHHLMMIQKINFRIIQISDHQLFVF